MEDDDDNDGNGDSYDRITACCRGSDTLDPWYVISLNPCEWETIPVPPLF